MNTLKVTVHRFVISFPISITEKANFTTSTKKIVDPLIYN